MDLADLPLPVLKRNLESWQLGFADVGWNSLYWNNHDQPRAVSRFGDDGAEHRVSSAKTLATVLHLHRGTPFVYEGEELGMTNAGFEQIGQYRDIESVNHHAAALGLGTPAEGILRSLSVKSRDNARTPMQWDDSPHAGFTTGEPWLAVNPNHTWINVAAAQADPASVLAHYRALIALRHTDPVVSEGDFELLLPRPEQLWVIRRTHGDRQLLVVANCSSQPCSLAADGEPVGEGDLAGLRALVADEDSDVLLPTHPDRRGLELAPWESRVYAFGV